ncbi:DUF4350 domain-containing protein [Oryzobacter telluris]|uniref:DUF4350 domain-containing protein n=1 Tax=Oryzobacter telluris TaxID=3149179 RepID=UPI00370D51E4
MSADTASADTVLGEPGTVRPTRPWQRFLTRRTGAYAGVVALGVVLLSLLALSAQRPAAPLDPEGVGPVGARALAEVLRRQGVEVEVVRSIAGLEGAGVDRLTTVLVADPTNLGSGAAVRTSGAVRDAGRLVLVNPDSDQLRRMEVPVTSYPGGTDDLPARCDSPLARDDDAIAFSDTRFLVQPAARGAVSCFPLPGPDGKDDPEGSGVAMVELPSAAAYPNTVVVGFGSAWTNESITAASDAGLAVRALGSTPRLVWYQPGTSDLTAGGPGEEGAAPADVWPAWTWPATTLVFLAVVLLALARGRRLGRLVREPLPVVVRAVETTESRGRLYRRSGDRQRAATVLRVATRDRLGRRLAVPRAAGEAALVHAVASVSGLPAQHAGTILFGPPPADDSALIQLAQQLTDLEERVRHP